MSVQALQVLSLSIHKAKGKSSLTKLAPVCFKKNYQSALVYKTT